jgi:glucuronate isomerase
MATKTFLTDDFLLENDTARELYFDHAAPQPIYDYHCHLPPRQIASNHSFSNLSDIWLAGDHYKWRAMRANGIAEDLCSGDADGYEKFLAFVRTLQYAPGNPLYHWSHLELLRVFGIDLLITEANAAAIWEEANARLATPDLSAHGLLASNRVGVVGTTDDPADPLDDHEQIRALGLPTKVYPTFRPDKALLVDHPELLNPWCDRLASTSGVACSDLKGLLDALKKRHDDFHALGGRLSDHGLESCFAASCTPVEAGEIFARARAGTPATSLEREKFGWFMMIYFGHLDAAKGWTKQLHLGALRNTNSRLYSKLGPDTGFDSISDVPQARSLAAYLDALDSTNQLPKTILYNLNPSDNYAFATMVGNFQDGSVAGKIQFGSGWWHLDQRQGMEWQLEALSQLGLLRRFVGMLTDSRSFLSYTRHEYFRRILCNKIGGDAKRGLLPDDRNLLGAMVREICFTNARNFFGQECEENPYGKS